jgi:hypothetical protein
LRPKLFRVYLFAPRFGPKAEIISGDHDPADRNLGTFDALFPKDGYFSDADLIGPNNLIHLHPSVELNLSKSISVTTDVDFFWRESPHDGVCGMGGNLIVSGRASSARHMAITSVRNSNGRLTDTLAWDQGVFPGVTT